MQVFIALGYNSVTKWGSEFEEVNYAYPFADPDEAIAFVDRVQEHNDDADRWEIITEVMRSADEAYAAHRKWVEE